LQAEILGYFEKMEAELGPANPDVD
jgi:hypothetical protein